MKFEIKKFNELTVDEMYEIAKSRFEVFVCEQEITEEQDFDDKDKLCHHVELYLEELDMKIFQSVGF